MASSRSSGEIVGQIRTLYRLGAVGTVCDRQLLDRFLDRTDLEVSEAACGELIERHGPMVLSLCDSMTGHPVATVAWRREMSTWMRLSRVDMRGPGEFREGLANPRIDPTGRSWPRAG